jgi:hypothetical protein
MLTMPERVPVVIPPFTPKRGDGPIEKTGELVKGPTLHVLAAAGAVTVKGTPHCVALEVPADCTVAAGDYEVDLALPDGTHQKKSVKLGADDVTLEFP